LKSSKLARSIPLVSPLRGLGFFWWLPPRAHAHG
jgi:hypothetical protein